jgi:hypothetical protein
MGQKKLQVEMGQKNLIPEEKDEGYSTLTIPKGGLSQSNQIGLEQAD